MNNLETNVAGNEEFALPSIRVSEGDLRRLTSLADSTMELFPRVAQFLAREMDRATVVPTETDLRGVIRMGSEATYRDEESGVTRTIVLVYPHEANIERNRVSILTPVGAALIGLSAGQRIDFQAPGGEAKSLTVLAVSE